LSIDIFYRQRFLLQHFVGEPNIPWQDVRYKTTRGINVWWQDI
jgi:hypothetical protein